MAGKGVDWMKRKMGMDSEGREDAEETLQSGSRLDASAEIGSDAEAEITTDEPQPQTVQIPLQDYELLVTMAKALQESEQQVARWRADFENYRRRTQLEKEDLQRYAVSELLTKMLPVLDNFDRAMAASYEDPTTLRTGVEMIRKQQLELLAREGLSEIDPLGESFDPNLHECVMRCDADADTADNQIVEVLQKGYMMKERLLRPAMVKVAQK